MEEQQTVDIRFQTIYDHAVLMAEKVSVTPAMLQQAKKQQHCSNAPTESVVAYYRKNAAVPFFDHIVNPCKWDCVKE